MWIADLKTQSLTNLGPGMNPKWHPTQDLILFQRPYYNGSLSYSIYTIDTEGKNLTLIVRGDRWVPTNPVWSPDGKRIAFATCSSAEGLNSVSPATRANDIWTINTDGSQELRVTEGPGQNWHPTWAKVGDEDKIFFVSDKDNQVNIWSLNCSKFQIEE
jgi:Tol biopolymer transport system component